MAAVAAAAFCWLFPAPQDRSGDSDYRSGGGDPPDARAAAAAVGTVAADEAAENY